MRSSAECCGGNERLRAVTLKKVTIQTAGLGEYMLRSRLHVCIVIVAGL